METESSSTVDIKKDEQGQIEISEKVQLPSDDKDVVLTGEI